MDALLESAGPLPQRKRRPHGQHKPIPSGSGPSRPTAHKTVDRGPNKESIDPTHLSILSSTRLPSQFHSSNLATGSQSSSARLRPDASVSQIKDKKLRAKVARTDVGGKRAKLERADVDEWLNRAVAGGDGGIEVDEDEGERVWRVGQEEIVREVGVGVGRKKFDLKLEGMGTYHVDYTRNGRFLAIASTKGHVATFDWQAGKLNSEIQLKEAVRDIKFLQSEAFYAVAQKKYIFIYDQDGVELHKLKQHIDPTHLEFLPYHYLLVSTGHAGYLKYHDVSTGLLLTQIPSHLGSPSSMAQNPHSGIIHLGHANGTMTLWSPNMTSPHVKLLAHRGPVNAIAVDPSEGSAGRYVATSGMEGKVKIWDGRMWGKEVTSWSSRNTPTTLSYSGKGILAVGGKSGITTYRSPHLPSSKSGTGTGYPEPYINLGIPGLSPTSVAFCPFDDVLVTGHGRGISSLLVPGSGEANFDSAEADVYESRSRRRERDVRSVLEKIRPELITLDTEFLGRVGEEKKGTFEEREKRGYRELPRVERLRQAEGEEHVDGVARESSAEEEEDGEGGVDEQGKRKKKARGKNSAMKRYLRKKKANVIDPSLLKMRAKVDAKKREDEAREKRRARVGESGALARFG